MSLHVNSVFEITVNLLLCATKVNKKWGGKKGKRKVTEKSVSQKWPLVLIILQIHFGFYNQSLTIQK